MLIESQDYVRTLFASPHLLTNNHKQTFNYGPTILKEQKELRALCKVAEYRQVCGLNIFLPIIDLSATQLLSIHIGFSMIPGADACDILAPDF